jgi:glycosyltransferase involved in cell wall biosynthesis
MTMKILCFAPVMAKSLCDDYYMYKRIHDSGSEIVFIAGKSSGARAGGINLPPYENYDGFPIHRIYKNSREMLFFPRRKIKEVLKIARELNPDLILCHLADNMRLALMVRANLDLTMPIVLHLEIAGTIPKQKYVASWKMRPFRWIIGVPSRGLELWSWLCQKADGLITSHPPDQQILLELSKNKPIFYLPWPASLTESYEVPKIRDKHRGIYAGLLIPFKNTQQFEWVLPAILKDTPTKEFIVIGAGTQAQLIRKVQQKMGESVKYIPRLETRAEVLNYISGSYFGFTPVKEGGWGFIGDCWGTGTPLIMLNNVFCSKDLELCVAKDEEDLVRKINRLYEDPYYYNQVQDIGYKEFKKRTANAVGDELLVILSKVLSNWREYEK